MNPTRDYLGPNRPSFRIFRFCVANLANAISVQGLGNCTAGAQRAQRKSPKNSNLNKRSVNSVLPSLKVVVACANFLEVEDSRVRIFLAPRRKDAKFGRKRKHFS